MVTVAAAVALALGEAGAFAAGHAVADGGPGVVRDAGAVGGVPGGRDGHRHGHGHGSDADGAVPGPAGVAPGVPGGQNT